MASYCSYFSKMPNGETSKQGGSKQRRQPFSPMVENLKHFYVAVTGTETDNVRPISLFEDAKLSDLLLGNIFKAGYDEPSTMQKYAIPYILQGRDVMGLSPMGTGKTAAYVIPLLDSMIKMADMVPISLDNPVATAEPRAVIILSSVLSANKVKEEIYNLSQGLRVKVRVITDGKDTALAQMAAVQRECDILIATPNRLLDYMRKNYVSMRKCKYLVFDDGNRLSKFMTQIESILKHNTMPPKRNRQTLLFFSETAPSVVQSFFGIYMVDHIFIFVGKSNDYLMDISQELLKIRKCDKQEKLFQILEEEFNNLQSSDSHVFLEKKILILAASKTKAVSISAELERFHYSITTTRNCLEKQECDDDVKKFALSIMVVTPAAAEAFELDDIDLVINYDLPTDIDEYIRRLGYIKQRWTTSFSQEHVGRTISFFDPGRDRKLAEYLMTVMIDLQQSIPTWLLRYRDAERLSPEQDLDNEAW